MASIHKDPRGKSPYWYAAYTLPDGSRHFKSTKLKKREDAYALALELERSTRDIVERDPTGAQIGKLVREIYERATGKRVEVVFAKKFLTSWAATKAETKAYRTGQKYIQVIDDFLASLGENSGKITLSAITPAHVQGYVSVEQNGGISGSTIEAKLKVLMAAFNKALQQGIIPTNPVAAVEKPDATPETRMSFTQAQVQSLVSAADGEWKTVILLAACCGMRLGDCINLKWGEVNLDTRQITYTPQKTSRGKKRKTLTPYIHDALYEQLKDITTSKKAADFINPTLQKRGIGGRSGLSKEFIEVIMKKAGIEKTTSNKVVSGSGRAFSPLSFHSLRHAFNTELANQGVSQETRRAIMGHASDKMNDRYTRLSGKVLKDAIEKLPLNNVKQ